MYYKLWILLTNFLFIYENFFFVILLIEFDLKIEIFLSSYIHQPIGSIPIPLYSLFYWQPLYSKSTKLIFKACLKGSFRLKLKINIFLAHTKHSACHVCNEVHWKNPTKKKKKKQNIKSSCCLQTMH